MTNGTGALGADPAPVVVRDDAVGPPAVPEPAVTEEVYVGPPEGAVDDVYVGPPLGADAIVSPGMTPNFVARPIPAAPIPEVGAEQGALSTTGVVETAVVDEPPPVAMSQVRVNELAQTVVDLLADGQSIAALDALHGARGGDEDHLFPRRFRAALERVAVQHPILQPHDPYSPQLSPSEAADAMLNRLSHGERVLFDAYVDNPGGLSRPEDIAFLAVDGVGTGEAVINDIYTDLANRFRSGGQFDRAGYEAAVAEMDRGFLERYGERRGDPDSLDADLTEGYWSELGGADERRYRAARAQSPAALQLWLAGQGRVGADENRMLSLMVQNAHRIEEFAAEYGYVADGEEGQGLERLEEMIADELGGVDAERARALLDASVPVMQRAANFANLTLSGVTELEVPVADATRVLRQLTEGESAALDPLAAMSMLDPEALRAVYEFTTPRDGAPVGPAYAQLRAEASELNEVVSLLSYGMGTDGGDGLAAQFETRFSRPGQFHALGSWLDGLNDGDRQELLDAVPDIETQIRDHGYPAAITERLVAAALGEADAADYLHWVTQHTAAENELLPKVLSLGATDRAAFAQRYEERYGEGSFERALDNLDSDTARSLRMALTVPTGGSRGELDSMIESMRAIVGDERGNDGWVGASTWFTDTFGFSGPVVDDSLRELSHAAQEAADYFERTGELTPDHVRAMMNAQQRLQQSIVTYDGEREDIAQAASDIAIATTSVFLVGGGVTLLALRNAAALGGTLNVGTHAMIEGPNYTGSEAVYDFFAGAALEVVGLGLADGAVRGAGTIWSRLRP
ncbi:MAG: hypothetical protein AAFQ77_01365 [Myxococcota bacterium]